MLLCWDLAKYVNHSFNSKCFSTAYGFEITVRDIEVGVELNDDYGYFNLNESFEPSVGSTTGKKVYQPLIELVSEGIHLGLQKILLGEKEMNSILNLYYQR